jgi:hypothetical protein
MISVIWHLFRFSYLIHTKKIFLYLMQRAGGGAPGRQADDPRLPDAGDGGGGRHQLCHHLCWLSPQGGRGSAQVETILSSTVLCVVCPKLSKDYLDMKILKNLLVIVFIHFSLICLNRL